MNLTDLETRRAYDAVKKAIGNRPFLILVPEAAGFGVSFVVADLNEKQVKQLLKDCFVFSLRPPNEIQDCPPGLTAQPPA